MSPVGKHWFTETYTEGGSAFSLRIRRKLHEEQSAFQKIEVYETETYGNLMVIDGCTMVSARENFIYHEMLSHPALFTHDRPRHVAIIGGGDCGTLREVLKHEGVQQVTQIDIDERVTRVAEEYFPELCESNNDPRAKLLFIDGIQWIRDATPGTLDLIIVDSTDPVGPGAVLFSDEFYGACYEALADGGLIVVQSESPLIHKDLIKQIHDTLASVGFAQRNTLCFPQPIYPSGWWSATMGGKGCETSAFRPGPEVPDTRYYSAALHQGALALPPFLVRALED